MRGRGLKKDDSNTWGVGLFLFVFCVCVCMPWRGAGNTHFLINNPARQCRASVNRRGSDTGGLPVTCAVRVIVLIWNNGLKVAEIESACIGLHINFNS